MAKPRFNFVHHAPDMTVGSDADHLAVALPGIAPLEDLDRYATNAPLPHKLSGGFVEVDGIPSGEGEPIVVDLEDFPRGPNPEQGAAGPACPVGSRAVDCTVSERSPERRPSPVSEMVALALRVGGGANLLDGSTSHGRLVLWERVETPRQEERHHWKPQER